MKLYLMQNVWCNWAKVQELGETKLFLLPYSLYIVPLAQTCQTQNTVRVAEDVLKPKKLSAGRS